MTWRRGELWLDTDLVWFRERAGTPSLTRFATALPTFGGAPPGLAASLRRRQAWKQRRNARKVRTAALVITPAVAFPLGLRAIQDRERGAVVDDPPSLTFHIGVGDVQAADTLVPKRAWAKSVPRDALIPARRKTIHRHGTGTAHAGTADTTAHAAHRTAVQPVVYPKVEWHQATSVGLPWDGYLENGTQLPIEGKNWVTWQPVTNTVPNEPDRLYGNEVTIRRLIQVIDAYREAHPEAPRVVVGDISRKGGGPFTDEHASHQDGLDVDVYYPRTDGKLEDPFTPANMDHALSQDLVDRFVAAGAQLVLVGFDTGLTGPSGVVLPYAGHDNHMHVRFANPG